MIDKTHSFYLVYNAAIPAFGKGRLIEAENFGDAIRIAEEKFQNKHRNPIYIAQVIAVATPEISLHVDLLPEQETDLEE